MSFGGFFLPPDMIMPVYTLSFVGFLGVFFGSTELMKYHAAEYLCLKAIIRPHNIVVDLFLDLRGAFTSEVAYGIFDTFAPLAVPFKHPVYNKVNKITIHMRVSGTLALDPAAAW